MSTHLKQNIVGLDLGTPERFTKNDDALAANGITEAQLGDKIPLELRYTCIYWANHLGCADIEDAYLMNELELFGNEHLLHWFEALSWIGKLDLAPRAVDASLKLLVKSSVTAHAYSGADTSRRSRLLLAFVISSMMHCASYPGVLQSFNDRHFTHITPLSPLRQRGACCTINITKIRCIIFVN